MAGPATGVHAILNTIRIGARTLNRRVRDLQASKALGRKQPITQRR